MLATLLLLPVLTTLARNPIEQIASNGAEILANSRISGSMVRQCSCQEQSTCVDEMKNQAKQCTEPCFSRFSTITDRPQDLRMCLESKDHILENFLECFENKLEGCVNTQFGPQINKTNIATLFKLSEKRISHHSSTVQSIIQPIKHVIDAAGSFAMCVKDCFLEKNKNGFCFDRKGCQPLVIAKKASMSLRQCTRHMHWKKEAGELCECSVRAGVTMPDDVLPLGGDRFEQRIPVDRRRLEAMITGKPLRDEEINLPQADTFFDQVNHYSGALVLWPAQLKIGAKTKRDPFVKVQGTYDQIARARTIIISTLQTKKERLTLKVYIHHSIHSHIIGKGGKGIQQIMRKTKCHIHFPDSNKFSENSMKSDQVSISGPPKQIDLARTFLRSMVPVMFSMELPWKGNCGPSPLPYPEIMSFQRLSPSLYACFVRGTAADEMTTLQNIALVLAHFSIPVGYSVVVRTSVAMREEVLAQLRTGGEGKKLFELSEKLGVEVQVPQGAVLLSGTFHAVIAARKSLLSMSPVSLAFDIDATSINTRDYSLLEETYNIQMSFKKKINQPGVLSVLMKTTEENVLNLLRARDQLLGLDEQCYPTNEFTTAAECSPIQPYQTPSFPSVSTQPMSFPPIPESPRSPDPDDSPMAASILKGAKDFGKSGDRWSSPRAQLSDRSEMLTKAAHALFDDSPRSGDRYPTDHFAGYGFSCSLPADLLKGMLEVPTELDQGRLIVGRDAKTSPSRGLCSVREEDEMSNFTGSLSSTSGHSIHRQFGKPPIRPGFSASTSMFDAAPMVSEFTWDVRVFTDPAHVLAQLGCSEYLAQMRDQEIDMHAFILLDEQNLKDIGISTIGARKKIHHAILKLRESARMHGFAV